MRTCIAPAFQAHFATRGLSHFEHAPPPQHRTHCPIWQVRQKMPSRPSDGGWIPPKASQLNRVFLSKVHTLSFSATPYLVTSLDLRPRRRLFPVPRIPDTKQSSYWGLFPPCVCACVCVRHIGLSIDEVNGMGDPPGPLRQAALCPLPCALAVPNPWLQLVRSYQLVGEW